MDKVRNAFNIITIAFVSIDIFFRRKLSLIIHDNSWKIIAYHKKIKNKIWYCNNRYSIGI